MVYWCLPCLQFNIANQKLTISDPTTAQLRIEEYRDKAFLTLIMNSGTSAWNQRDNHNACPWCYELKAIQITGPQLIDVLISTV
jgi:hypothetical protein